MRCDHRIVELSHWVFEFFLLHTPCSFSSGCCGAVFLAVEVP